MILQKNFARSCILRLDKLAIHTIEQILASIQVFLKKGTPMFSTRVENVTGYLIKCNKHCLCVFNVTGHFAVRYEGTEMAFAF